MEITLGLTGRRRDPAGGRVTPRKHRTASLAGAVRPQSETIQQGWDVGWSPGLLERGNAVSHIQLPDPSRWGHVSPAIAPTELVERLRQQTERAIDDYLVLPEGPEPCNDQEGYHRVSVVIPLPTTLFDQLMNGATGYRAHYSVGIKCGESFNRCLVEAVAPIIVRADYLYKDRFDYLLCRHSLLGPFSKFWFTKELTDPSAQDKLLKFKEELREPRWLAYWRGRAKPWKGLLAPVLDDPAVLLNGSFVNGAGEAYEQKPGRSKQLFDIGWT